jgi:hypothetical protein
VGFRGLKVGLGDGCDWLSGVMALSAIIVPLGVGGLLLLLPTVLGNDNFICRLPFV